MTRLGESGQVCTIQNVTYWVITPYRILISQIQATMLLSAGRVRLSADHVKHPAHAGVLSHDDPRQGSAITWAPCLFDGLALDGMGVDHGGSDVAVTKPFLHGTDVVMGV